MKRIAQHKLPSSAWDGCSNLHLDSVEWNPLPSTVNPGRAWFMGVMRLFALVFLIPSFPVMSAVTDGDDPSALFDTSRNIHSTSKVTWIPVNNIQVTCEREAQVRGYPPFGFDLKACSFFENDVCVIFTSKKVNMHTLGHEVRHCFQGWWHE